MAASRASIGARRFSRTPVRGSVLTTRGGLRPRLFRLHPRISGMVRPPQGASEETGAGTPRKSARCRMAVSMRDAGGSTTLSHVHIDCTVAVTPSLRRGTMSTEHFWLLVGFVGQAFFTMRFVVQWIASERRKESVIPVAFWFFSIGGGLTLFTYALHRLDPVFILGEGAGIFIYSRNLYLIWRKQRRLAGADHAGMVAQ